MCLRDVNVVVLERLATERVPSDEHTVVSFSAGSVSVEFKVKINPGCPCGGVCVFPAVAPRLELGSSAMAAPSEGSTTVSDAEL